MTSKIQVVKPTLSGESDNGFSLVERLHVLSYSRSGEVGSQRLLLFDQTVNIGKAVELGKEYCRKNELRFMFIRRAIEEINVEEIIE